MSAPPRLHPLVRSPHVERVNTWLESAWKRGLATRPTLDPEELWAKAKRKAPRGEEFGSRSAADAADFRLRLEVLCSSLQAEANLNPLGLTMAHGQLVRALRQRLELGALWQAQPEILETTIAPPIIVVGHMRSGSTRVHRLLASDPQFAATRFCDSWNPVPRRPDTRPAWSAVSLAIARTLNPWLDSIHPFGVTRPDEELGWLACALDHGAYEAQWRMPAFTAFSEARDPAPVYREFARILRTDAHFRGNAGKPRVLKVPQFAEDLPALLGEFPQARVVRTIRADEDVVASGVSLVANQMTIQSDAVDLAWIKSEVRRKVSLREERIETALAAFSGPQARVAFTTLDADWAGEIDRIYAELGLTGARASFTAMQAEIDRSVKETHREHSRAYAGFAET